MTPDVADALQIVAARKPLPRDLAERTFLDLMDGQATEAQKGAHPARDRDAGRDRRRDRRRGRGAAEAHAPGRDAPRSVARHLRSGRPRPGPLQPLDGGGDRGRRARAPPSRSTATAPSPPASDRQTSSRRAASRSTSIRKRAGRVLDEVGLVFLFAPAFHPAMKELGTVRRELGVRTIFNALGPLANPAGAARQLIGVGRPELVRLLADALASLGTERADRLSRRQRPGRARRPASRRPASRSTTAGRAPGGYEGGALRQRGSRSPSSPGATRRPTPGCSRGSSTESRVRAARRSC